MELRFHEDLYDAFAIDEAVKVYEPFATIERKKDGAHYVLTLTASPAAAGAGVAEGDVGAELLNYALGKTILRRGLPGLPGDPAGAEAAP